MPTIADYEKRYPEAKVLLSVQDPWDLAATVRTFVEFLRERFQKDPDWADD